MSTFTLKLNAAKTSKAWQLALDKYPFDVKRTSAPWLTRPDEKQKEQSIKHHRLVEIKDRANAATEEWKAAMASRLAFFDALERQHGPRFRCVTLVNSSRLLLHLGRASVLENVGLYADRTTGLPVIPGSAIKGVVSTWACWESHFGEADGSFKPFTETSVQRSRFADPKQAFRILGDNAPTGSISAGQVVFLGAWPEKPPVLGLDIVTPHHDASGRDQDPIPNPFLCVEAGTPWRFGLLAHPGIEAAEPGGLLDTAERWLTEALEQSGLGAKSAAGYGRFIPAVSWNAATQSAASMARIESGEARAREREENLNKLKEATVGDYTEATIKGAVLNLLSQPQQAQRLQIEIKRICDHPANHPWIVRITEALKGKEMRDHRKRLKEKDWFPNDWIPS